MRCRPFDVVITACMIFGVSNCVDSTKVGLTNVRAREWRESRPYREPDVIANGDDSCPRADANRSDPTPIRFYACPGRLPEGTRVATPR